MNHSGLFDSIALRKTPPAKLRELRDAVSEELLKRSQILKNVKFKHIATRDLRILFESVDNHYFDGCCQDAISRSKSDLTFRLSKRMTSCGGTTTMEIDSKDKKQFEIAVATTLLFDTFRVKKSAKVGGINCRNSLEALTRIMEHEMVHLIELLLWDDSNCSAKRFQQISWRRFGHLESNHQLLTPSEIARSSFGIKAGDHVTFRFHGKQHFGWVNRITKRATVLVKSSKGVMYNDGVRYLKYYVPISQLSKTRLPR